MKTIWKYKLSVEDRQEIEMPKGAEILCVQLQGGEPCIWALVNEKAETEKRVIRVFGTGKPIKGDGPFRDPELKYIGTFQLMDGVFVLHVFEDI